MGNIFKRGSIWCVTYNVDGVRYRETVGPVKKDAITALEKRHTEIAEHKFLDPRKRCTVTFAEFAPQFKAWSKANKRSHKRDEGLINNLLSHFGNLNLGKITLDDVERFKRARLNGDLKFGKHKRKAGNSTVNRELACLRKVLNLAVAFDLLSSNQLAGKIKLKKEPDGRCRYLLPAEAVKLLDCCSPHLRPVVYLAMLTGMRKSEVTGLRWPEVNFRQNVILLPGERTKNGRPRTLPMNVEARAILLERWKARYLGEEQKAECEANSDASKPPNSAKGAKRRRRVKAKDRNLVFHKDGQSLGIIHKGFVAAVLRAGIVDFKFHDLRHCFGSALAIGGVSLQAIGELLGHRTLSMTQRYAHLSPQVLKQAVGQASAYFKSDLNSTEPCADILPFEPKPLDSEFGDGHCGVTEAFLASK